MVHWDLLLPSPLVQRDLLLRFLQDPMDQLHLRLLVIR